VEYPTNGAAALVAVPIRPIRPDPGRALPLEEALTDATDLGALVRRLEDVIRWLRVRGAEVSQATVLRFGAVEVEPATQTIRRDGTRVPVTRTEFRLLYALMRRPGQVVEREELRLEVWGPDVRLRSRAIDTHIARLRRKLEADPSAPRHIHTAPYRGYRFDPRGE
jgi:two-component system KDP operon response regulator KdpE